MGETIHKRRRKRPSRWSDCPPSPVKDKVEEERCPDRPLAHPLPEEPVMGDIYDGKISSIMQFGCFVQLEGLRLVISFFIVIKMFLFDSATHIFFFQFFRIFMHNYMELFFFPAYSSRLP